MQVPHTSTGRSTQALIKGLGRLGPEQCKQLFSDLDNPQASHLFEAAVVKILDHLVEARGAV